MPRRKLTDIPHLDWCGQYTLGGEEGHTPIPCYSISEWGRWMESADRCIAWTGGQDKWVSTVFLGLDHRFFGGGPPLVFESIAFADKGEWYEWRGKRQYHPTTLDQDRYSSWDDAEIGHKAFVRKYLVDSKTRAKTEADDA